MMGRGVNNGGKTLVLDMTVGEANYLYEIINWAGAGAVQRALTEAGCTENYGKYQMGTFRKLRDAGAKDD